MNRSLKSSTPDSSMYSTKVGSSPGDLPLAERHQRHLRAFARRVAHRLDLVDRDGGDEADHLGAPRVDVGAEGAGEHDLVEVRRREPSARIAASMPVEIAPFANCSSRTSELREHDRRPCKRERPVRPRASRCGRPAGDGSPPRPRGVIMHPAVVEQAGQAQLRDDVDQARPTDASGLDVAADHLELDLAVRQGHALDRTLGGAHPVQDLRRPRTRGRRARRSRPRARRCRTTISPFVPTSTSSRVSGLADESGRHDVGDDVGPDVGADRRVESRPRPAGWICIAELVGAHVLRLGEGRDDRARARSTRGSTPSSSDIIVALPATTAS